MASSSTNIPIDPALLELDAADGHSDSGSDQEDELAEEEGQQSSSDEDNDSEDAYVEDDDATAQPSSAGPRGRRDDDAVFSRLAGQFGQAGDGGLDMASLNLDEEMARVDGDDLPGPSQPQRQAARRTRKVHRPSHDVQRLVGQANIAYARGETERTISLFLEVIRHDPYVISAWNTLASVYKEDGNDEAARQMRFFAAHVEDESDAWRELATEFRQRGQITQCVYCLKKVLNRDSKDVDTLFELASIYRLQSATIKAVNAFKRIIRLHEPSAHDFTFLAQFHALILEARNVTLAANSLKTAFDYHITHFAGPQDAGSSMQIEHVVSLVDDLTVLESFEEAIVVIRRGQRWFQGRKDQTEWDTLEDDREYDSPGVKRPQKEAQGDAGGLGADLAVPLRHRLGLLRLKLGNDEEAMVHFEVVLDLDVMEHEKLFLSIGNALFKRKMWGQALDAFVAIQECDGIEIDDPNLIYSIAVCEHEMKDNKAALEALRWVIGVDPANLDARFLMASVLEELGDKAEALEIVSEVIRERAQKEADETTQEPTARKPRAKPATKPPTKAEQAGQRTLTKRVLEDQMRTKMQALWTEVQEAEGGIAEGEWGALDRFIQAAGTMIENFRLAKTNFTKSRGVYRVLKHRKPKRNDLQSQALALQDRLEREMGFEDAAQADGENKTIAIRTTEFYGLECEEWLNLVIKYCCVLMIKNEEDIAMDILEHVIIANLFNTRRCEIAIRMTIIACALRSKSYERIVDNTRRLAQLHQFRNEPYLLLLAALAGGGQKASQALTNDQLKKFLHRDLRIHDDVVKGGKLNWSGKSQRWTQVIKVGDSSRSDPDDEDDEDDEPGDDDDGEDDVQEAEAEAEEEEDELDADAREEVDVELPKPKKFSPVLNAVYGQYMLSRQSYTPALFYLLRAYEITQNDPLICLCIAQAYFGRATQRQVDNRNQTIQQGFAFLIRYRKLSPKTVRGIEEVEYNYARSFQGLGVTHLAVEHYERVIRSVEKRMASSADPDVERAQSLVCEAAHSLMQLYAASGNMYLAQERSKWLAI